MIALALSMALATAPSARPDAARPEEITVIGKRMADTHGAISLNPFTGKRTCKVLATSGEARIDQAVCAIALQCSKSNTFHPGRIRTCVEIGRRSFLIDYFHQRESIHAQD